MFKKIICGVVSIFFVVNVGLFVVTYFKLEERVNLHVQGYSDSPEKYNLPYQIVSFTSLDKTKIAAWYIKAPQPKGALVLVHGYGMPGGKAYMLRHAQYLYKAGYSSLLIDMGGFGESERQKVTFGIAESGDVAAAYQFLVSKQENLHIPVGLLGYSMGAASVVNAAGKYSVGQFAIELDGYRTIDALFAVELTKRGFPAVITLPFMQFAGTLLLGNNYNLFAPERFIKDIHVPLLILHGSKDTAVPIEQGKLLYFLANDPKKMIVLATDHGIYEGDPQGVEDAILSFLATVHN